MARSHTELKNLMRKVESKLIPPVEVDIDTWESEGGACRPEKESTHVVRIPDYPAERTYSCPGCNKGVSAKRIGNSCSYLVEHVQGNECKYKGPVKI